MSLYTSLKEKNNHKGFTLAELLIVTAILVILFAIGIPALFRVQRNLRQEELDRKAEIIYQSAQNRLAELNLSGSAASFQKNVADVYALGQVPDDAAEEDGITADELYYITSEALSTSGSAASAVMTGDVVDEALLNSHWVIEYDPASSIVYAVFYSETRANCAADYPGSSKYDTQLRYKENRLSDGANVGYYGGGSGTTGSDVTDMQPSLTIVNEEKLQANATCTVPTTVNDYPVFRIDLSDTNGHTVSMYYAYYACTAEYLATIKAETGAERVITDANAMKKLGRVYSLDLTLDDLSSNATRFVNMFGAGSAYKTKLDAGTPLTVTVTAMCPGNYKVTQNLSDSQTTNSLFDDSTEVNAEDNTITARLRYGRHLQNLDQSSGVLYTVTKAEQISDITFTDQTAQNGTKDWYETYSGSYFNGCSLDEAENPLFKPVTNTNLLFFDGAPEKIDDEDSDTKFRIVNLNVNTEEDLTDSSNAGLFGTLGVSGKADADAQVIRNVILTGAKAYSGINSTGTTAAGTTTGTGTTTAAVASSGALAGEIAGNTTLQNCQSFLTNTDINDKTNHDIWISGTNAGGLIGLVSGGTVTIGKCGASSTVGDYTFNETKNEITAFKSENAGGLIGTVTGGNVSLSETYADSYLAGRYAGGLVGTGTGTINLKNCYAAGFATYETAGKGAGAGLVLGTASMTDSYTILYRQYMDSEDTGENEYTYFATAKDGSVTGTVYYSAGSMTDSETESVRNTAEELDAKTNSGIAGMKLADLVNELNGTDGTAFKVDTSDSSAYNLMGQSLTTYTYPELTALTHYGDWNASFQSGALVYYECYEDGSYGFYGANVDSSLKNQEVYGDGYGFAFLKNGTALPNHLVVTVTDGNGTKKTVTLSLNSMTAYEATDAKGKSYVIYPLPLEIANITTPSSSFYLKTEVKNYASSSENDASLSGTDYYYFNPHFAKTVVTLTDSSAAAPKMTADTYIYVRSPRHLYLLSQYYNTYRDITAPCTYRQECNLDYHTYIWTNYYDTAVSSVKVQSPIGRNEAKDRDETFEANYDGRYHWIRNISFTTIKGNYAGLFGQNEGRISNVVLRASYKNGTIANSHVSRTGSTAGVRKLCMGALAGCNTKNGSITNCAVAGYDLSGSDATIHAYKNCRIYVGGLTGRNEGTISSCSADTPQVRLSTTYANAYAGGLTGYNTGIINNSYALGHIEVVYSKGGSVSIAGFAGFNSGAIRNSYCATALTASGSTTESYGFSAMNGKVTGSYYLNNGTFSYMGTLYPFECNKGAGISADYSDFTAQGKTDPAVKSYDFNSTNTESLNYPFRAVVTNSAGEKVHYGNWLDDEIMGACGIFYWEHEENGENNGYHFTYLGINEGNAVGGTTLCESHDDGGIITEYGYGFYEQNENSTTLSLSNAISSGTTYNQTASKALQAQFKKENTGSTAKYYFHAYTTRTKTEADGADYICMSGTGANSTWTLKYTPASGTAVSYTYTVCPFFANAMQYSASSVSVTDAAGTTTDYGKTPGSTDNTYEVRSYDQLQYINWDTNFQVNNYDYREHDSSWSFSNDTKKRLIYIWADGSVKNYHWVQSHDLEDETAGTDDRNHFVPLGQAGCGFEQCYDGQCYKIKNLYISSQAQFVALFGSLGSAELRNIVLCADEGQGLIESTYSNSNGYEPAIGALVGQLWGSSSTVVDNCVASGYDVQYNGTKTGYRYITVGGLIGELYNGAGVSNCAAANNVKVLKSNKSFRKQIGGLIGSSFSATVTNCYSGGTLYVEDGTYGLYGGLVGNAAGNNGGSSNTPTTLTDNNYYTTIKNCYTYCDVPKSNVGTAATGYYYIAGNLRSGSITNCYYMKGQNTSNDSGNSVGLTYDEMSDGTLLSKLNGNTDTGSVSTQSAGFHNVSTTEGTHNASVDGKYSFPVSASLDGKNYPFPAIIEQKDLVFSTASEPVYVYVHYGDWPVTGPYFENGRDSMDIFADMNSEGTYASYATREYKLYANGSDMSAPAVSDFISGDETIAKVVNVGALTDDNDGKGGYYPVTVEAIDAGTALISLKNTSAAFDLEVTAGISLQIASDPSPLKIAEEETGKITLYAVTTLDEDGSIPDTAIHYETADSAAWSIETNKSFTYNKTNNKNEWKITRDAMGAAELTVTFDYDYHGVSFTGTTYIQVLEPDMVGLSDGSSYNAAQIGDTDRTGSVISYGEDAPASGTGDFFLYLTASDSEFSWDAMKLESVLVDGVSAAKTEENDTTTYKTEGTDSYEVVMNNTSTSDSGYRYLSGTISCITTQDLTGDKKNVPLTVVVSDVNGTKYTLNITLSQVDTKKALTITYKDQAGHSAQTALMSGSHNLPTKSEIMSLFSNQGTLFTVPAHQIMTGWKLEGDGTGKVYSTGESYKFTGNVTFTAVFEEVKYSVTMDANGGAFENGSQKTVTLTQEAAGEDLDISKYTDGAQKAVRTGYTFNGWNTKADGSGTAISGTTVTADELEQLDEAGTTTLYAQWKLVGYKLTLVSGKAYSETFIVTSSTESVAAAPGKNGTKTLDGWYTSKDGKGTKVLNADGTIAEGTLTGYTSGGKFALTEEKTLYAQWSYESVKYVLTNSIATGEDYLIVDRNTDGSGHALSLSVSNNSASIASVDVTVLPATAPYVDGKDGLPVWNYTSSYYLSMNDWYVYRSSGTNIAGSKSNKTAWTYSNNSLYYGGWGSKYYLYYSNNNFALIKSTVKNVYLYQKTTDTAYTYDHDA